MKKILLFARDPGGANVLIPLWHKLEKQYEVLIYGKDVAWNRFRAAGIDAAKIWRGGVCEGIEQERIQEFLKACQPDCIITGTSLDDYTERYLWKEAECLGIKSFAVLDQWMNLGIRFSAHDYRGRETYAKHPEHPYLPYRILAMDGLAAERLRQDGIPEDKICITGQPHFQMIKEIYKEKEPVLERDKWNVVYASEPILQDYDNNNKENSYWGFNELTSFELLYACLEEIKRMYHKNIRLVLRPHPREEKKKWEGIIKALNQAEIEVICNEKDDSLALLKNADVVCGMSSMFLLEAAICRKPIISMMVGLKRENPFVLDSVGICKSRKDKASVQKALMEAAEGQNENMKFDVVENGADNIIALLEEEMQHGQISN